MCIVSGVETSAQTMTNSSPPNRATVSLSRMTALIRPAAWFSSSSPLAVPERVVDDLELVDVEEDHPELRTAPPGPDQALHQPVGEQRAVRQAGQGIVQCLMGEFSLDSLAIR